MKSFISTSHVLSLFCHYYFNERSVYSVVQVSRLVMLSLSLILIRYIHKTSIYHEEETRKTVLLCPSRAGHMSDDADECAPG